MRSAVLMGSYRQTMRGLQWAKQAGLPVQINTVFAAWNADYFEAMADLVENSGAVFWEIFFLVPTGRGGEVEACSETVTQDLFARIWRRQQRAQHIIKVTEAPHYRVYVQQKCGDHDDPARYVARPRGVAGSIGQSPLTVNAGRGHCFISHTGDIYPSGFLPQSCGNVKTHDIARVYRWHPVFVNLRRAHFLRGQCGDCQHGDLCGGSRARAFADHDDYLGSDDSRWLYEPAEAALTA